MKFIKNVQYFIHRYYEFIKLILLGILILLGVLTLINIQASEAKRSQNDERVYKELISLANDISERQQVQHDHQDERAACFFELFVSYTRNNPRTPITDEEANKCRVEQEETQPAQPTSSTDTPAPTATQPQGATTPQRMRPEQAADKPQTSVVPEERTLLDHLVQNLTTIFRR